VIEDKPFDYAGAAGHSVEREPFDAAAFKNVDGGRENR